MGTPADLGRVLRELRRRHARRHGGAELTYRELATATGWSHGIIGEYLGGKVLPPTERFDVLVRLLGATPREQGLLATARDRVEEQRRAAAATGAAVEPAIPRQLPADVFGFTGRSRELADLDQLLEQRDQESSVGIASICGTAGVGKTALVVHWAHRIADRFPDGQLYVALRGYDPEQPIEPNDALAACLRSLGVASADIPAEPAERAARYRTALAGRRVLVVLDNASGVEQVRPLLPGTRSCLTVVTSRDTLAGLVARDGAERIDVDPMSTIDSVSLLRNLIGPTIDSVAGTAEALAERCARLPLALRIAAEFVIAHPDVDPGELLPELLEDLRDEHRRLDFLDSPGDQRTAVRSVFSWSCRQLSADAARAFGLLGLHPSNQLDGYAMSALAGTGIGIGRARALLDELARAHLVEPAALGWFTVHDLLREYAAERVALDVDQDQARVCVSRLFDHYLNTAAAAVDTLFPHDRGSRPARAVGTAPTPAPPVELPVQAAHWLDRHRATLVIIAGYAARRGWPEHAIELSRILWRYFEVGCHYQEALAVHTVAADAARRSHCVPDVLTNLGSIHWWLGDRREAQRCFDEAIAGHRDNGPTDDDVRALGRLALVHERLGDYPTAAALMNEALSHYRSIGNRHGEGSQLINLGILHRRMGRYPEAAEHHRQAATIFGAICDQRLLGYAMGNLGAVESLLGHHDDALTHLQQSLANCRAASDRGGEGSALAAIGAVYQRLGRQPEALQHVERALAISRATADHSLETEALNTLGLTLSELDRRPEALTRFTAALALAEQAGDRFEQARALAGMAQLLDADGRADQARSRWQQALDIYLLLGVPQAHLVRQAMQAAEQNRGEASMPD